MMVKAAPRLATILCLNRLDPNCTADITYRWLGSYRESVHDPVELCYRVAYIGNANRGGSLGGSHDHESRAWNDDSTGGRVEERIGQEGERERKGELVVLAVLMPLNWSKTRGDTRPVAVGSSEAGSGLIRLSFSIHLRLLRLLPPWIFC